jgi:hypothetical protein
MSKFTEQYAAKSVSLVNDDPFISGGRAGTVRATKDQLVALFGEPQKLDNSDDKVKMRWVFRTPRGFVEVRDYWWNAADEWSIGAENGTGTFFKATRWIVRFMRSKGLVAHIGTER